jgi:hypothetical protein
MPRTAPMAGRPLKLRAFRLTDIPLDVRRAAALRLADVGVRAFKPERGGRVARSASPFERFKALELHIDLMRAAESPSPRVYRVSQEAWDAMIASADGRAAA